MAKVVERFGHSVTEDGFLCFDDRPTTYEAAEKLSGVKLDRRRNYAIVEGKVCRSVEWSSPCSGCCDDRENVTPDRGSGCHECGYTGMSRSAMWIPIGSADIGDCS